MKYFITGGAGFIGTHLASGLNENHSVKIYDLKAGDDILDFQNLKSKMSGNDIVIHLAAMIRVAECELDPAKTIQVNAMGTHNVLQAALENNIQKVIFASSAAVYGRNPNMPLKEGHDLMPVNIYGLAKAAAERIAISYFKKHNRPVTCLRIFNIYGLGQDSASPYAAVIPIFIEQALQDKDLIVHGDGRQTRDFVYIKDVIKAVLSATDNADGEIINLASGRSCAVLELAQKIIALTGAKSKIIFEKEREGDIKHSVADIAKAQKLLGYSPAYDIETGLKEMIIWSKRNLSNLPGNI